MSEPYAAFYRENTSWEVTYTDSKGVKHEVARGPGEPYIVESPCDALLFLNAFTASKRSVSPDDTTKETIQLAQNDCNALVAGVEVTAPPEPPPVDDPSSTGQDTAPPGGDETVETLNPPTVNDPLRVLGEPPAPYESGGGVLAEDYYRPINPIPDYVVIENLLLQNVQPDQLDNALESVIHNESEPGQSHHDFGKGDSERSLFAADPVDLFTGRYSLSVTDIEIPSRGFPLQFTRFYRSGPVYFGPWGYNWDHNYNVYLRQLADGGVAIWTGHLHEDVYKLKTDGSFEPPLGVFLKLEWQAETPLQHDRYIITDREGKQQVFERPDGWPHPDRIPLVRIEDRHGNAHKLQYDPEGRLQSVSDHAGRYLHFTYGDCGLLEKVEDHTSRLWQYYHDDDVEHLVAVITPPIAEYPDGLTTCYEYDRFRRHPALIHNLTRVIDPAGQVVVENSYGDDPDTDDFGRVVYQEFGGFIAGFRATQLQYVPRTPDAINIPVLRVEVVDEGFLAVYTFNYRGDLLDERFRLVKDESYRLVARVYRYDEQGNLIEQRGPNGLGSVYTYDHENDDPRARGNLLQVELVAPPTKPAQSRIVQILTYDSKFHRLKTARDENGALTTLVYDYQETITARGDIIRIEQPKVKLPNGSVQESAEHFEYNTFGQLLNRQSGEGHVFTYEYYADGQANGYLKRFTAGVGVENQFHEFEYDLYGYLSQVTDALGSFVHYDHNALGQLTRTRKPGIDGLFGEVVNHYAEDGYLKTQEIPRGAYKDSVIQESFIQHEFEYDVLGNVRAIKSGVNTASPRSWQFEHTAHGLPCKITDPLGRVTRLSYDERDLVLEQTLFVGLKQERSLRFVYDRNGNLKRVIDPTGLDMEYEYDSWDRLRQILFPGRQGERTHADYYYGTNDVLERLEIIGVPAPGQTPVLLSKVEHEFDKLSRPIERREAALKRVFWYDRDSCLVQVDDERGNSHSFVCDALGRTRRTIDPLGNQIRYTYDAQGNLISVDEWEIHPGLPAPQVYHTDMEYDARNRLRKIIDPLHNTLLAEYDDRDLISAATQPLNVRSEYGYDAEDSLVLARGFLGYTSAPAGHIWQRDLVGRVIDYVDPEGKVTVYQYAPDDQWSQIVFPDGSIRQRLFDAAGRLIQETTPSGTTSDFQYGADGMIEKVHFNPGPGVHGLADLVYGRDGLGRPVQLIQGNISLRLECDLLGRLLGETVSGGSSRWSYDDLNGLADLTYPDGRVDRYQFDAIGRITSITLHQLAVTPLTGPTLVAGSLLAKYEYVGPQRLLNRKLGNGCETKYSYDSGRRLSSIEHRTASNNLLGSSRYVYDAASRRRLVRTMPSPGVATLLEYDQLSRLNKVLEGINAPDPPSDATQADADAYLLALGNSAAERTHDYTLNRADARNKEVVSGASGITTDVYTLNELYQIIQLERTTSSSKITKPFTYHADGQRSGDDRFSYTYDVLGRLTEIRDLATANLLLQQEFDPMGRVMLRTFSGVQPERKRHLGFLPIQDETSNGDPLRQRCFGITMNELIIQSEGADRWTHHDALLSLMAVSDYAGTPVERYSYTPFGMPSIWSADGVTQQTVSTIGMEPIFGGHRYLGLNGLYDARARTYDSMTGQFIQRDRLGYGDSANLYAYVGHDPVNLVDSTGEVAPIIAAVVIIGALAGAGYSVYDSYHHPERYEGWGALKGFGYTVAGAGVGALSVLGGEAVLAIGGIGASGTVTASSLTLGESALIYGTASAVGGTTWRLGFHGLFPEYNDAPTIGTVVSDFSFGTAVPIAGPALSIVGRGFANSTFVQGVSRAAGPWRPFGNQRLLVQRLGSTQVKRWFWDPRTTAWTHRQYWKASGGAHGKHLHHWLIQNQTRSVPHGIRNAGFNKLEIPGSLNSWMGGRLAREFGFRLTIGSILTGTGYGSYKGTEQVLQSLTTSNAENLDLVLPSAFGIVEDKGLLAIPSGGSASSTLDPAALGGAITPFNTRTASGGTSK
jgi:RHS repeat-associated protein